MKLENCGRCGLEPEIGETIAYCPVHPGTHDLGRWNAAQFAARTERINAEAGRLLAASFHPEHGMWPTKDAVAEAVLLIDAQDDATRQRWAEMQGGE